MENQDTIDEQEKEWKRKEKELHDQETENTITTLRVKKITRDQLAKLCTKEMSFNEAIIMLLDFYHKREKID